MLRTTSEASGFSLWQDGELLTGLVRPQALTTARYEPVLRFNLGAGHLDLLFESAATSCVVSGIRLEARHLLTREASPFIWPERIAALVGHAELSGVEERLTPWLRSIARARSMAAEAVRRFVPSARFERARSAGLFGAVPLGRSLVQMAPFVYARRFAARAQVKLACPHAALAHAVLATVAEAIERVDRASGDDEFACAWYAVPESTPALRGRPDMLVTDRFAAGDDATVIVETQPRAGTSAHYIAIPTPAPYDLLLSFDEVDAPAAAHFAVRAHEAPLRAAEPSFARPAIGGSSGSVALAISPQAAALRGPDFDEVQALAHRLSAEGLAVSVVSDPGDPAAATAELVHIFGAPAESHTSAFAEAARTRGVPFAFDIPPLCTESSAFVENMLCMIHLASCDDAENTRYLAAYAKRAIEAPPDYRIGPPEQSAEERTHNEARFTQLARAAIAIFAGAQDVAALQAALAPDVASRVRARGTLAGNHTPPEPIGALVPTAPFAFAHGPIARHSHVLLVALAAQRSGVPLVIAGPVYDVEYLQLVRLCAPSTIVLADADAAIIAALYRRATLFVDAAPRPRSAAAVLRAIGCGALPVLARESPLAQIAGPDAPVFSLLSIDECSRVLTTALQAHDVGARVATLQNELRARSDVDAAFTAVIGGYAQTGATHGDFVSR